MKEKEKFLEFLSTMFWSWGGSTWRNFLGRKWPIRMVWSGIQ